MSARLGLSARRARRALRGRGGLLGAGGGPTADQRVAELVGGQVEDAHADAARAVGIDQRPRFRHFLLALGVEPLQRDVGSLTTSIARIARLSPFADQVSSLEATKPVKGGPPTLKRSVDRSRIGPAEFSPRRLCRKPLRVVPRWSTSRSIRSSRSSGNETITFSAFAMQSL